MLRTTTVEGLEAWVDERVWEGINQTSGGHHNTFEVVPLLINLSDSALENAFYIKLCEQQHVATGTWLKPINSAKNNTKLTLPFKQELHWPYIYVEDAVSSIISSLLHNKIHNYSYNVSGPDYPLYGQIAEEIKNYFKNFKPIFSNLETFPIRELFSINKIKNEIGWKPRFDIKKGIRDFVRNMD